MYSYITPLMLSAADETPPDAREKRGVCRTRQKFDSKILCAPRRWGFNLPEPVVTSIFRSVSSLLCARASGV